MILWNGSLNPRQPRPVEPQLRVRITGIMLLEELFAQTWSQSNTSERTRFASDQNSRNASMSRASNSPSRSNTRLHSTSLTWSHNPSRCF